MGITKSFEAALSKARTALWQGSPNVSQYNKGPDLVAGDYLESLAAVGRAGSVLPLIGRDASDRLRIGGAIRNPLGTPIRCMIQANGKIATGGFFANYNDSEALEITRIDCIFSVADGAANTGYITKEGAAVAPGAGDSVMSGTFNLNATANTLQTATLIGVPGNTSRGNTISGTSKLLISAGEQLSFKMSAAIGSLAGLAIVVWVREFTGQPPASLFLTGNGDIATMTFFLNVIPSQVIRGIAVRWSAAGTNGSAVTMDVTKDVSTNAPGAGTSVLAAALSVKTTANTTMYPALAASAATLKMAAGDRLALKMTGTLAALAGLVVTVFFEPSCQDFIQLSLPSWDAVATDRVLFIADRPYEVVDAWATWSTASSDGNAQVVKDTGTDAPGAGTDLISNDTNAGIDTALTANTPNEGALKAAFPPRLVMQGDRVSIDHGGTTTSLAGFCPTVLLRAA